MGGASALAPALPTGCGCEAAPELAALQQRIAGAPSLDEARALALAPAAQAQGALARARFLAPRSAALADAQARLDAYAAAVAAARSGTEVAERFGALLGAGGAAAPSAHFWKHDCDYTTGEIIAIVLGFILGIIPGIILLILLC